MRIFYCDPGLAQYNGHHVSLCDGVVTELRARGLETVVLGAAKATDEVKQTLGVQPHFRFLPYYGSDGDPICGWVNAFTLGAELTANDFAQIPFTGDDVVFFTGTMPAHIQGLAHWIAAAPPARVPRIVMELSYLPGITQETRDGQEVWITPDPREDASAVFFRFAGLFMKTRGISAVRFATLSRALLAPYAHLLCQDIALLPAMPYDAPRDVRNRTGRRPITVAILGHQTHLKGYRFMPEVFEGLLKRRRDILIVAHNGGQPDRLPDVSAALMSLAAADSRLSVTLGPLGRDAYKALLDACDLVVCPYSPELYAASLSAVVAECFASAIPMVLPAGTVLAQQFETYGRSGVTFDAFDAPSIMAATERALDGFDAYAAAAVTAAERWRTSQGAARFVDAILQLAGRTP